MSAPHLRFVAAPLTLILCFIIFLINDQRLARSSAASGADHSNPLPSLNGDAAVDHLKREGIYDRLIKTIESDLYRITTASGAYFAADNSAQHLRAEFSRDGVLISPIRESAQSAQPAQSEPPQKTAQPGAQQKSARKDWQMRLRLHGYGYGDATQEVAARLTRTNGNRIETIYVARSNERPALSEWHINRREGIEHGFTIAERPGVNLAGEPLRVKMKVDGDLEARLADGGGAVVFVRRGGREMLRYDHLVVEDAYGRRLDAWMEASGAEVSIVVDEAGAVYPLTIDPLFTRIQKLTVEDGQAGDRLGFSVSISDDTVVVGADQHNSLQGAAYIFERNWGGKDNWGMVQKLVADDGGPGALFGFSVGISDDTVVVGAFNDSGKGAAYIFARNNDEADEWGQVTKLMDPEGAMGDLYGWSVSISNDTVVVGAPRAYSQKGAAYIYERNNDEADEWGLVMELQGEVEEGNFGWSVGISFDTVVVGARRDEGPGAAYIFGRNVDGWDMWGPVKRLTADDGVENDLFGHSVSISADTVVVGAPQHNSLQGAAYIFERNQDGADMWGQVAKLPGEGGQFGWSVGISSDTVIVGPFHDSGRGAAYIYERNKGGADKWGRSQKLRADDGIEGDWFGYSVAISFDTVIVGAPADPDKGAAYIYTVKCDEWVERYQQMNPNAPILDGFGDSVAISADTIVVGAPRADSQKGAAYIFERNKDGADMWGQVAKLEGEGGAFGDAVAISADTVVVGAPSLNSNQGAVYIFARNEGGADKWGRVAMLEGEVGSGFFGQSVAISGDTVVISAPLADLAYIYERNNGGADKWGQVARLTRDGFFGFSVAVSGDTVVISARSSNTAYIFERNKGGADKWEEVRQLTAEVGLFGNSVGISGDTVVVGAPGVDSGQGAAYVFARNEGGADRWGQVARLEGEGGFFGISAGISSDTVVIGAHFADSMQGQAFIFSRNKNGADKWGQVAKLEGGGGFFGISVGVSDDTVVVGATGNTTASIYARDCGPCAEMPTGLPAGTAGTAYSEYVTATPSGNYSYSLLGGMLPEGFSLDPTTGLISGTTNIAGTYNFTIQAERQDGCLITQDYTLVIECAQIMLDPGSFTSGTAGTPYSQSVAATASGSYYYTLLTGMLPPGLSLNPTTGLISGLTRITGSYDFTIRAQSQDGCTDTESYTLVIECPEITLNPESLPDGAAGTPYSATVSASPATGSYTFTIIDGSLPPGLSLNATTGRIAGTPTTNGPFSFRIKATGFGSCSEERDYSIRIGSVDCPMITLADLPSGKVGKIYNHSAAASPAGVYSYTVSGTLPPGVNLYGPIGLLYGYPTTADTYIFTITAKDSRGCEGIRNYEVTIHDK